MMGLLLGQSDDQINQAKKMLRTSGMSVDQAKATAKSHGYSDNQIEEVLQKEKGKKLSIGDTPSEIDNSVNVPELGKSNLVEQNNLIETMDDPDPKSLLFKDVTNVKKNPVSYFGYDIFSRDPAIFQATSIGIVDPDYLIGPGDEIIVMLWGETQFRQVLKVNREGFVFIPEIGQVFVNGLNLNLLESKLFKVLSQSYASLNPQGRKPTTFLDVSLGNLRPLRIQVLGEVSQPGAYTVSPSATLFSSLYYFNGPTTMGSLRDIRLIRGGNEITKIDFYDYLLSGKKPKDQKLQLDDVIFIPRRLKTVMIEGEVNRPGIYELKSDENIIDLITMAGELKITAYLDRAQIDRIVSFDKRAELGMERVVNDVNLEEILEMGKKFPLQDGDHIQVFSIQNQRKNVVEIQGAVTRPGSYDLGDSLRISELISKADGILGDAFLDQFDVIRIGPDLNEELITLSLKKVLDKDNENDIELHAMDRIRIYSINEITSKAFVTINGHVKNPGKYQLLDNMNVYDLLFAAGGIIDKDFKAKTFKHRADLIRYDPNRINKDIIPFHIGNVISKKNSKHNFTLQSGDEIRVYSKAVFNSIYNVNIDGVIRNPGSYTLKNGMTIKDLILEAGGVSENVFLYKIEIARIDPKKVDESVYAEVIELEMFNDYSIKDINYSFESDSDGVSIERTEFNLKPYDHVSIRPDPYFRMQRKVVVMGAVYFPGVYAIKHPDETITNIINRAGGLRPKAYAAASTLTRNGQIIRISLDEIIAKPNSDMDVNVQSNDEIFVALKPDMTQILGEVVSPGIYKYVPGKKVNDYIRMAGGYTVDAEKKEIWITFPDGDSRHYNRWLSNPKVLDGSIITIGKEKEKEPFDTTEFAKELSSILADFAQILVVVAAVK